MSDIETVVLDSGELKVEGMNGQNTIIVNRSEAALYASIYPGIVPDGDNVAAIQPGGAMNLLGTNGTLYLLGTGKAQLEGTDISWLPMSLGGSSGGGGSTGGVSQGYVDSQDALTLNAAKKYTDDEIDEVRGEIPAIPESLPADGGNAETTERLKAYTAKHNGLGGQPFWVKFAESQFTVPNVTIQLKCECRDAHAYKGYYPVNSDEFYGCYDILFRVNGGVVERAEIQWEYLSASVKPEDVVMAYYIDESSVYHVGCFVNLFVSYDGMISNILSESHSPDGQKFNLLNNSSGTEEIPEEYTTIIPSTIMPLRGISDELADLKAYIGYTDNDIYGLEADFENNKFTRLAGAVGKTPGADFDSVNAFGGRKRCALSWDGRTIIYRGDANYEEDAYLNNLKILADVMVEQPKFYYKVVPLKTEKIDGADGHHLRKARYYISDTPKPGFKVHPAFIQNGVEVDKIYLSAYEGCIRDASANAVISNDEQIADFNSDQLLSIANAKPASGATQALTRANARKLAQNRGAGWGITTIQTLSATQLLFAIEYATFNSQTAIGAGNVYKNPASENSAEKTGATSVLGNMSGSTTNQNNIGAVSYRGEENIWGNILAWVDGIYEYVSQNETNTVYVADHDFSSDVNAESWYDTKICPHFGTGFVSAFGYSKAFDWLFVPSELTGNGALPVGDHVWNNVTGLVECAHGGGAQYHDYPGLFCYGFNMGSYGHASNVGARLIYIPQPEEVTAND